MVKTVVAILTFFGVGVMIIYFFRTRKNSYLNIRPAIYRLKCREGCTELASTGDTDLSACVALCDNNFDVTIDNQNKPFSSCATC